MMINWLPKPTRDGANRTRSSSTRLQAEKVWHQIPEGLRIWCVQFEPGMWNGQNAEMLQVLEEIVVSECAQVELMEGEVQQSTQLSTQYSSMALRHAVVKRMVACGMQAENCRFVLGSACLYVVDSPVASCFCHVVVLGSACLCCVDSLVASCSCCFVLLAYSCSHTNG